MPADDEQRDEVTVVTDDGWALPLDLDHPRAPAVGTVIFCHALAGSRRSFDGPVGLRARARAAGWRTAAFDFRGHGTSAPAGRDAPRAHYDGLVRFDLPALADAVGARFEGPLVLVGQGLGGHVACAAAGMRRARADAIALVGSAVWLPRYEPSARRRAVKTAALVALRLGPEGRGPRAGLVRSFERWWKEDRWRSDDGLDDYLASFESVTCPILTFTSEAERFGTTPACVGAFVGASASSDVTPLVAVHDAFSGPAPAGGALLASAALPPYGLAFEAWLARALGRERRGARG